METFFLLCGMLFTAFFYAIPTLKYYRDKAQREGEEEYRYLQLRAVRAYYEAVQNLSYDEIKERYNVEQAYQNIGRVSGKMKRW